MKLTKRTLFNAFSVVFLAVALCVTMLCIAVPEQADAAWNGSVAGSFASGSGTSSSPYLIKTAPQLAYFVKQLDAGVTYDGLYIRLDNDLDMTGNTWSYSNYNSIFQGTFDGRGYTITADCPFLPAIGKNGTVKGLNYHAAKPLAQSILCTTNQGTIFACVVNGDINSDNAPVYACLICKVNQGTIRYCGGAGDLCAAGDDSNAYAALIGENSGSVDSCYAAVTASASAPGKYNDPYQDPLVAYGNTPLTSYYDNTIFTYATNTGTGISTATMQGAKFLTIMRSGAYTGIQWITGTNGYPAVAPGSDVEAYLTGWQDTENIIVNGTSQTFTVACSKSGATVYYTLDGSDPTTSSTRKSVKAGSTLTVKGDAIVSLAPYVNSKYGNVKRQTVICMPGSGTEVDPYQISSVYSLNALRLFPDKHFKLTASITVKDSDYDLLTGICPGRWTPVPTFSGTLDGAGYCIYNLKGDLGGLVASNSGTIQNLRMVNHQLIGFGYSGTFANRNTGTITRCYAKSAFTADSAPTIGSNVPETVMSTYYGGIAGYSSGTISYCRVEGVVYGLGGIHYFHTSLGGIAGSGSASHCVVEGTLIMLKREHPDWAHIGGISGETGYSQNCYTDIDVINYSSADYSLYCGGISGSYSQNNNAYRCVAEDYNLTVDLPGGYGIGSKYKTSFCYYSPYQCYVGGSSPVSSYPDLDFEKDWMETDEGIRPQGVIDSTGHSYSIDPDSGNKVCSICGDGAEPAEVIASGDCGTNATWTLDDNGLLTVYGTGAMTNYASAGSPPWYVHKDAIKRVYISDGITSVGDRSFYEYSNITSARLPEGLTNIGYYAFYHCSSLSSINLPSTLKTFGRSALYGSALTSVVVPDGVTSLHEWVFGDSPNLVSVTLPDSITSFGKSVFSGCTNLKTINIPTKLTSIPEQAFWKCSSLTSVHIPDSVTSIGRIAFAQCTSLTEVTGGSKVTSIGEFAFELCSSLKSFVIPDSVTSMGQAAFHLSSGLTDVTIGNSLTQIPNAAFSGCTSLKNLVFKSNITSIGDNAFSQCSALESIQIPNSVTTIGECAFVQSGLKEIVIPDSVTSMGIDVFAFCSELEKITFGSSLTSTERAALNCTKLKEVIIREGVTTISEFTFQCCTSLRYIVIPKSVTRIEKQAFDECPALEHVLYKGTQDQWNSISISSYNSSLTNAMRHYNAAGTEITLNGTTLSCSICIENSTPPEGTIASGSYNQGSNIFYWFVSADGTLTVSGNGALNNTHSWDAPWKDYVSSIKKIVIKEGITSLEYLAFGSYHALESVSLPASLAQVDTPFSSCSKLKTVTVHPDNPNLCSDDLGVIYNKDKTTLIRMNPGYKGAYTIPNSVTTIGEHAFHSTSLSAITLPSGLKVIGREAFYQADCNFTNDLPNTLERIEYGAFLISHMVSVNIPASVQYIGSEAFNCSSLKNISVDKNNPYYSSDAAGALFNKDKTTLIAFPGAYKGAYIVPDSVTKISDHAFWFCRSLTTVYLPEGLTSIGSWAFASCDSLTSITIPSTVSSIGSSAFQVASGAQVWFRGNAVKLDTSTFASFSSSSTSVTCYYPANDSTWDSVITKSYYGNISWTAYTPAQELAHGMCGERVMWVLDKNGNLTISGYGDMYDYEAGTAPWFTYRDQLRKVDIQKGVTGIGNYAFYKCPAMTSISINNTVVRYGERAFSGWSTLTNFTIAANATELGDGLFEDCTKLSKVTLPNTLWKIGSETFANCTSLVSFTVPANVTEIGAGAFSGCSKLTTINIPNGVTQIADRTFRGCSSLKEIALHDNIAQIGAQAFAECTALESVSFPAGVTAIGDQAFSLCVSLSDIKFHGNTPKFGGSKVFDSIFATASYPAGNTTWTDAVKQNYGGSITWKAVCYGEHTPELRSAADPTCTVPGYTGDTYCALCDELLESGKDIPALGHTEVTDAAVEPTCTEAGLTEGKHCSVCNAVLTAQQTVPAKGHTEVTDKAVAPTCTATGLTEGTHCSVCNAVTAEQKVVPAKGHVEVIDKAVEATCTTAGKTEGKHCSVCNAVLVKQNTVAAKGHTEVTDPMVAPTCTATGLTGGKHCSVCNTVIVAQKVVAAKGHTEVTDKAVAPTCTADGKTEGKHCSVCNTAIVAQKVVSAKGHTEVTDKAVAPTCTAAGKTEGKHCSVCGTVTAAQQTIPAKGHTEVIDKAVAATCTENGLTEGKHCSVCNAVLVKQQTVKAKGHSYKSTVVKPTAETQGYTEHTCDLCGDSYRDSFVDPTGHNTELKNAKAATCTTDGYTGDWVCKDCGKVTQKGSVIAAKGHTEVVDKAVAATCTTAGKTEGKHCSVCNTVIKKQETVPAKGHTLGNWYVSKAATCTAAGEEARDCSACNHSETRAIAAKGHTEVIDKAVAATCTKTGLTEGKHCSVCGTITVKQQTVPVKEHTWDSGKVTKEPTENAAGTKTFTCTICKQTRTETIPALGHTHSYTKAVTAPTCTAEGYTTYTCKCGDSYTADRVKALGHDYKSVVTKPTCTEPGYTTYTCSRCADTYTGNRTAALGHDYKSVVTKPTCEAEGYTTNTCSRCKDSYTSNKTPATGHKWDNSKVTKQPTEQNPGEKTFTCTACKKTRTEVIPALEHTHKYTEAVTKPTCTEQGYTTYTCACGESYTDDFVKALGHSYGKWTVSKAATCEENGEETRTCTRCSHAEKRSIEALGHDYKAVVTKPTCTEQGYTTHTCARCADSYVDSKTAALGHSWDNGIVTKEPTEETTGLRLYTCTTCGETRTEVIAELTHTHSYTAVVTAPTCLGKGYTTHTCKCGHSYTSDEKAALGHSYGSWTVSKAATCTAKGEEHRDCTRCDAYETRELNALGHSYKATVVNPTCEAAGYTVHECTRCADSYQDTETAATGHSWNSGEVTKEPTEKNPGEKTFTCSVCGKTKTEIIPALGHTHSYTETVTAPTCIEQGYTTYTCECGHSYKDAYTEPTGHDHSSVTTEPTCTEQGYTTVTCSRCGSSFVTDYVDAKGHSWNEGEVTQAPTEDATGVKTYTCTVCGETRTEVIPALGHTHTHSYTETVTAPTCTEQGYTTYTCECGESFVDNYVPAGHTFGAWHITKEPTANAPGEKIRGCACGHTETGTVTNSFSDVALGKYYSTPVLWAFENGITTGTDNGDFDLKADCTRKQIVMFLWRAAGKPDPEVMVSPFTDVTVNNSFAKAILWAVEQGITAGTGDGKTFSPDAPCTRKQIVMFLWRAAGKPEPESMENPFTDISVNNSFAKAILWAYGAKITTGKTESTFDPDSACTRGQIVTFLYRDMVENQELTGKVEWRNPYDIDLIG